MLEKRDSAIAAYEGYTQASRGFTYNGPQWDALYLADIYGRLGQLYDEQGEREKASEYDAKFVEIWRDADSVLLPRVQAAKARLGAS